MFLIRFEYSRYCQGPEDASETVFVHAETFEDACDVIRNCGKYDTPQCFENLTLWK